MRKKVLFLLAVILSLNVSMIKANAEAVTQVSITFTEPTTAPLAPPDDGVSLIRTPLTNTSGYTGTLADTGKRLPTTGDQCNQSLTLLGYLSLFVFVLCIILGKSKEGRQRETV